MDSVYKHIIQIRKVEYTKWRICFQGLAEKMAGYIMKYSHLVWQRECHNFNQAHADRSSKISLKELKYFVKTVDTDSMNLLQLSRKLSTDVQSRAVLLLHTIKGTK